MGNVNAGVNVEKIMAADVAHRIASFDLLLTAGDRR